jgi:hypothetical protein
MRSSEIPAFLLPARQVTGAITSGATLRSNPLQVELEPQSLSYWCWASVTSAIENFYGETDATSQCGVATRCLNRPCCPPGDDTENNPVNVPYDLSTALDSNAVSPPSDQIEFGDLQMEISASRPVCCVIRWDSSGDEHVVLAAGFTPTGDVWIDDPASPGMRAIPWNTFRQRYGDDGSWIATVKTKPSDA